MENANHQKPEKTSSVSKILKVAGGILIFLFAVNIISGIVKESSSPSVNSDEWATITTPDGRLTLSLPMNPTYEYTKAGNEKVEGYSYISEEYDGRVSYVVKYENWQSIADKQGIEIKSLDDEQLRDLLKANVDLEIKEFNVSNFVSEFTSSQGYRAIRFSGQIKKDNKTATLQGISVFAEGHLYTFVALSDSGYSADLERLLNSISFKF